MCFVLVSEQTAIISVSVIMWLFFITEKECVYCAVRAVLLKIIQFKFRLQRPKIHFYIAFPSQLEAFKFSDCTFVSCEILTSCATPSCPSHSSLAESYKRQSFSVCNLLRATAAFFSATPTCPSHISLAEGYKRQSFSVCNFLHATAASFSCRFESIVL